MALDQNIGMVTAYAYARSKGYTGTEDEFAEALANAGVTLDQIADAVDEFNETTVPAKVAEVTAEGTRQIGLVSAEGTAQVSAVQSAGSARVTEVESAIEAKGQETIDSIPQDYSNLSNTVNGGQVVESITKDIPTAFTTTETSCSLNLEGYSGKKVFISNKNLLPQFPAITDHGITCTQNADGSVTLNGTSDGAAVFQLSSNVMPNLGPGTYTISAGNAGTLGNNDTYINLSVNGSWSSTIKCRLNSANATYTFTVAEGERITAARIRVTSGYTATNFVMFPQIEEGTQATEFVAHDGWVLEPTTAEVTANAFEGYNYICAQSGVTGTVTYDVASTDGGLVNAVASLDTRVTALEDGRKFVGKKIVCFGDSITGNYQPPTDYPSMIAEITGATVYNAGFGGCCMSDNGQTRRLFTMCRLTDAIVGGTGNYGDFTAQRNSGVSITYGGTSIDYVPERLTMLEDIDWSEIDYITIAYGTNDWNSNYGLDNANDPLDTTTYIGAFRYAVETLLAKFPNIKILVITPLWRWWDTNTGMPSEIQSDYIDSNDYAKGTGYKLWQYGDALADAAKLYHVPVFDLYWNCMMTKQNRFEYFNANDGTHPKTEGRELIAGMISAQLNEKY